MDAYKNFAVSKVATAPDPAASGTSLTVESGNGTYFSSGANAVICPDGEQPTWSNAEIVRVTNISTDTLTITRAQEGTTARSVVVGDVIFQGITKKWIDDLLNGQFIVDATGKTTPVDADTLPLIDSADSNNLKKLTWANIKAAIKSYYDSVTATLTNKTLTAPIIGGLDRCELATSTAQSIPSGTTTAINFSSEVVDTNNMHDNTTNNSRVTIKQKGLYILFGQIAFDTVASGTRYSCLLQKNGSSGLALQRLSTNSTGYHVYTVGTPVLLDVNDYIEVATWHNEGSSRNMNSAILRVTQVAHVA